MATHDWENDAFVDKMRVEGKFVRFLQNIWESDDL